MKKLLLFALLFISGFLHAQSNMILLSWDKTGCQDSNTISEVDLYSNFFTTTTLKVCPESIVTYRIIGEGTENIQSIEWYVTGGQAELNGKLSTPIIWDNEIGGSIRVVLNFINGTTIDKTINVNKFNSLLLFSWDKTGCQENKDNVYEVKFDNNFSNSECLRVCKASSVTYKVSGENTDNITSIQWYITGGYSFITNEFTCLINWSNLATGSIRIRIVFNNGNFIDKTICVNKIDSSVLLGWDKIDENLLTEIKYDNSEDNSDCILIEPNSTIPFTISGKNTIDIQSIDWQVTGGQAYTPNQLSTLISWFGEEDEKSLEIFITYNNGSVLQRKINVANYNKAAPGGGGNEPVNLNAIAFDYDVAGNQVKRYLIYISSSRFSNPKNGVKDVKDIVATDLINADIYDDIKYYPNPVKEELYVQWTSRENNNVSQIELYSMTGQLLKQYADLKATTSEIIDFQNYPHGIYTVQLVYENGENKTLKIVKQ